MSMNSNTSYHQLGKFVVLFQQIEEQIDDLIMLLIDSDDELTRILFHELNFSSKLKSVDAMFQRYIDVKNINNTESDAFHKLIQKIKKLSERRNELVHSRYYTWINIEGKEGLLKERSKLKGQRPTRQTTEEEMLPEAFDKDIKTAKDLFEKLDIQINRIIKWLGDGTI